MQTSIFRSLAMAAMVSLTAIGAQALEVGNNAPLFEARSTSGDIRLADYIGNKHVVLAFYYADFTAT